jgi:hypothetical protein
MLTISAFSSLRRAGTPSLLSPGEDGNSVKPSISLLVALTWRVASVARLYTTHQSRLSVDSRFLEIWS